MTHVVAFLGGRWVMCRSERTADFEGYSRRDLRLAAMELRLRRSGVAKRQAIRAREMASMLREIRQTEQGLLQARKDAERRAVLEARDLSLVGGNDAPAQDRPATADADWNALDLEDVGSGTAL